MSLTARTTTAVNLRATPGGTLLTTVPKATSVEVTGVDGTWLAVRYADKSGFMSKDYLTPQGGSFRVVVTAQLLNLRAAPSGSAAILAQLPRGAVGDATAWQGDRLAVSVAGTSGWVAFGHVATAPADAPPSTSPPSATSPPASGRYADATYVRARRKVIAQIADATARGDAYEALQLQSPYASQRDNQATENGQRIETTGGRMCNLTSLAMVLSYLGIDPPQEGAQYSQYEDRLEFLRQARGLPPRTSSEGWGGVAEECGASYTIVKGSGTTDQLWWETKVRPRMRDGAGVMMSIWDHIVRVAAVRDDGLVVDDPYGRSKLGAGEKRTFTASNGWDDPAATTGREVVYPWSDVAAHTMKWIAVFEVGSLGAGGVRAAPARFVDDGPSDPDAE